MKTIRLLSILCSLAAANLISTAKAQAAAADEKPAVSKESGNSSHEDLGYDIFDGKTNRIARVAKVDPGFVWVVYEDGKSGRKIPRTDLPPQLQAKYPYDAEKAAAQVRSHAKEGETLRAEERAALQQKERVIQAQIDALDKQREANEKEIHNLNQKLKTTPHSKALKNEKIQMLSQQDESVCAVPNYRITSSRFVLSWTIFIEPALSTTAARDIAVRRFSFHRRSSLHSRSGENILTLVGLEQAH